MRLVILVIALALLAAAPAKAAWTQHKFPELGFGIDFPAEVKTGIGEWKGALARTVPTTVVSSVADGVTYEVIVADFTNRVSETPTILGEAAYILSLEGMLLADSMARTENGANAIYGRRVTVMLPNGSKKTSQIHATKGRLYILVATIPAGGDFDAPIGARFHDSLIFELERDRCR
jgi:hypothetical protein